MKRSEPRNSPADAKAAALKPNELTSLRVEFRMEASSSTITTRVLSATLPVPHGLLRPLTENPSDAGWYFNHRAIRDLRQIEDLRQAEGINLTWIKLILGLRNEVEKLRDEVRLLRGS